MSGWSWSMTPRAARDLERLPVEARRRIVAALDRLADDPATADIRKLAGLKDTWRLRAGDYRARFRPDHQARTFVVLRIDNRSSAYRD